MKHRKFTKAELLSIDTETTGLKVWKGDMAHTIDFFTPEDEHLYFEWDVDPWTRTVLADPIELEICAEILGNPKIEKIFHYAKFDIRIMEQGYGIETKGRIHETMFMAHAFNSLEPNYKLKKLSIKYLGFPEQDQIDLQKATIKARRQAKKLGWWLDEDVPADYWMVHLLDSKNRLCVNYCKGDTERTMLLYLFYKKALKELKLEHIYEKEMELWPITYAMETRGIRTDMKIVDQNIAWYQKQFDRHKDIVDDAAWIDFDIESPQQCGKLIYNKLKLPVKKTTPTGLPQVNFEALAEHIQHPVVNSLFKYRAASKALKSFFFKYKEFYVRDTITDGFCLHPDFQQVGPATGRYSCRRPNFQNVANALTTRSSEPIQAREPFGPREGYVWYHFDWSGQEIRIFADVSQELTLLAAIRAGYDAHTFTANKAWGGKDNPRAIDAAIHALELDASGAGTNSKVQKAWEKYEIKKLDDLNADDRILIAADWLELFNWDIEKAEVSLGKLTSRARAKMIGFAKIYGGKTNAVMSLVGCGYLEALQFIEDYDELYPRINEYIDELSIEVRKKGYITNRFGRRLTVSRKKPYVAVNYNVQGSAADLMKDRMIALDKYLRESGLDIHILMTVHDELILEFWKKHVFKSMLLEIRDLLEDHTGHFEIDLPVDVGRCVKKWNEKVKVKL